LIVRVESATLNLKAHGTGTPIHYMPTRVVAGAFSTCAIGTDELVSCWGSAPGSFQVISASFQGRRLAEESQDRSADIDDLAGLRNVGEVGQVRHPLGAR